MIRNRFIRLAFFSLALSCSAMPLYASDTKKALDHDIIFGAVRSGNLDILEVYDNYMLCRVPDRTREPLCIWPQDLDIGISQKFLLDYKQTKHLSKRSNLNVNIKDLERGENTPASTRTSSLSL